MTCEELQGDLVAYHFGEVPPAGRDAVEEHLVSCAACVKRFVALKREIELGESGPRPSATARARLKAAALAEVAKPLRPWRWWERPLAFGLASAAVMVALVFVRGL
ncbi:MAG: zf-HC2 domain-containing protein [Myxococcales bacterium]|nr:zf-HC2 domain-containing protein [Myxococcales bacterium]